MPLDDIACPDLVRPQSQLSLVGAEAWNCSVCSHPWLLQTGKCDSLAWNDLHFSLVLHLPVVCLVHPFQTKSSYLPIDRAAMPSLSNIQTWTICSPAEAMTKWESCLGSHIWLTPKPRFHTCQQVPGSHLILPAPTLQTFV